MSPTSSAYGFSLAAAFHDGGKPCFRFVEKRVRKVRATPGGGVLPALIFSLIRGYER